MGTKQAVSDFGDAPNTNDDYWMPEYDGYDYPKPSSPDPADQVNSPLHYNYGKVETIDYIMQVCALYPGHQAALVANVIKYVSRAPLKGDKEKDLKKAQWYLNKLLEVL